MNLVLLGSLGISEEKLKAFVRPLLEQGHQFVAYPQSEDENQTIERIHCADIAIIANMPISGNALAACRELKMLSIASAGADHVDLDACARQGIAVCNAAGYSADAVAEVAIALMLMLLRRLPQMMHRCKRGGTGDGLIGRELSGRKVGLLGTGAVGYRVAQLVHAFGCEVIACAPRERRELLDLGVRYASGDEMYASVDILSLHCPLNKYTREIIDEAALSKMKRGSYLINTANAALVDQKALVHALQSGHLAGAGVDVFGREPPLTGNEPLLHAPNVIALPHIGYATAEAFERRADIAFANIRAFLQGQTQNAVRSVKGGESV